YLFAVIDSPDINAFALPGGQVFVTTGMLGFVQSNDELAAVVGHEIAHVDLRHCIERYQYILKARKLRVGELGEAVQAARMLAAMEYSKYQEMDADAAGARLAQAAGYDPRAALRVFQRLIGQGGEGPEVFAQTAPGELNRAAARALGDYFRSHPTSAERSDRLNDILRR
ncbi:MAG: M48 family metallopeptidase, partial [Acidobacteria bacterium]|nr:M48 family metallopeptidase [Acidobacteriota bacterium]